MALTTEIYFLPVLEAGSKTGWDLGPFTVVLKCLHLDIRLLENKIKKKLYGIKNIHVYSQLEFWTLKIQRDQKTTLLLLKSPEQKQSTVCAPCSGHHLRSGQTPSHPCSLIPEQTSTLTGYKQQACHPPLRERASKGNCGLFSFHPATAAAAAAKSLQSCPTLCDPIEGSPLGSPVPGILQARTLEWVAMSFSNA